MWLSPEITRLPSFTLPPPTQDCPELGLDSEAVRSGHAVSYAAVGISEADEAALTLLPAASGWPPDKLSNMRQVPAPCSSGREGVCADACRSCSVV